MKQPEPIEQLLEDLQSSNPSLRKTAAEEVGRRAPAEPRTIRALHLAAQADTNEGVRSAAAHSFRYLTKAEPPQPSSETAATMTKAPTTSSGSRVLRRGGATLAAILSFVLNIAVIIIIGIFLTVTHSGDVTTILFVTLVINLVVALYLASDRQYSVVAGIAVGLVCALALAIGYAIWAAIQILAGGNYF